MPHLKELHRHGFMSGEFASEEANLAFGDLIAAQVTELAGVVDTTLEKLKPIFSDTGLNPKGKRDRMAEVGNVARDRVRRLTTQRRRKLDQDLKNAEGDMDTALPRPSQQSEVRQGEIRQALMNLSDMGLRTGEVQQAAELNDIELLLAVQDAPTIMRKLIIRGDVFETVKERWLELNRPDQFKRVETVRSALGIFEHNFHTAEKIIANATQTALRGDVPSQAELEKRLAAEFAAARS